MSKYCVMPFVSARITESTQGKIKVAPCCQFRTEQPLLFDNMNQYLESDFLKKLQTHFLTNEDLPKECAICQRDESVNQLSIRQLKQKYFQDQHFSQTNLLELDIFPSNLCNLACIMCAPYYSSAIGAEHKRMGLIKIAQNFDQTDSILQALDDLSNVKFALISGGEFFFLKRSTEILEKCLSRGVSNIKIITNGTVFDQKFVDLLCRFEYVDLRFSVDGVGDHYDLIRYPASWIETCKIITDFKQNLPDAHLETVMVLQPLNIYSIFDWCHWANQQGLETHWINISSDLFSWKMLNHEEKISVIEWLTQATSARDITVRQRLTILNLAKNTLAKEPFDAVVREKSIHRLVKLIELRKISWTKIERIFAPWPDLKAEIVAALS